MNCLKIMGKLLLFTVGALFFEGIPLKASTTGIPPFRKDESALPVSPINPLRKNKPIFMPILDSRELPQRVPKTPEKPLDLEAETTAVKRRLTYETTPTKKFRPEVNFVSPKTTTVAYTNYCKAMINALNNGNIQDFADKFQDFNAKLAYDIVPKTGETGEEANRVLFYKSLFYAMFSSFTNSETSVTKQGVRSFVKTQDNKNYLLRFHVTQPGEDLQNALQRFKQYGDATGILFHLNLPANEYQIAVDEVALNGIKPFPALQPTEYYQGTLTRKMLEMLDAGNQIDVTAFNTALTEFYGSIPADFIVKKENYFQMLFYSMLTLLRSDTMAAEHHHGEGRSDIIVQGPNTIGVLEFKLNAPSAKVALDQIDSRHYCDEFREKAALENKDIYKMGINVKVDKAGNFTGTQTLVAPYVVSYPKVRKLTVLD